MGIYYYITDEEAEKWSKVSDQKLNKLFQEARLLDESLLISERVEIKKHWFYKDTIKTIYTVYHQCLYNSGYGYRYQAKWQISAGFEKWTVEIYLSGLIDGFNTCKKLLAK